MSTFFEAFPCKFGDIPIGGDYGIATLPFLQAAAEIVPFFGKYIYL